MGFGQEEKSCYLQIFKRDVKVKTVSPSWLSLSPERELRGKIFQFSEGSRRRLLHVCRNSGDMIKSQFCLTYHHLWPSSGKEVKRNLNHFITAVKRYFGDIHYLWVLEFQERGAPHVHFFSDINPTPESRSILSKLWVITVLGQGEDSEMLKFHDHPRNFFPWSMKSGSYLSKEYLQKSAQKTVPEDFHDVGRFWGNSRNMIPTFKIVDPETVPHLKNAIKKAVRCITKAHERLSCDAARACRDRRRSRCRDTTPKKRIKRRNLRSSARSYTVPLFASSFITLLHAAVSGRAAGQLADLAQILDPFRSYLL